MSLGKWVADLGKWVAGYELSMCGSDQVPVEISVDAPPHRNSSASHTKYKFDQTDREVFKSTLEASPGSEDFSELTSTIVLQLSKCLQFEAVWGY